MTTSSAKQIVLAARPKGAPTAADFRLEETPIPTLPAGGLLLRVLYLSLHQFPLYPGTGHVEEDGAGDGKG